MLLGKLSAGGAQCLINACALVFVLGCVGQLDHNATAKTAPTTGEVVVFLSVDGMKKIGPAT